MFTYFRWIYVIKKVELNDKNINESIKEMLTNLFEIGDVKLEQQEFFDEYFQEIIHYFFNDYNDNPNIIKLK